MVDGFAQVVIIYLAYCVWDLTKYLYLDTVHLIPSLIAYACMIGRQGGR